MTNVNTQIYDDVIDRAAMIRLYERRVTGKVELIVDGHAVRVDKLIREAKLSPKGFVKLREAIDQDIQRTFEDAHNTSKRSLIDFANDQYSYLHGKIDNAMGRIWRTRKPYRKIPEDIVLKNPLYKNNTLEAGWKGVGLGERKRLEAVIRKGMAKGYSADRIAREVRKGSSIKISRFHSRSLVTTAITSVRSQVDQSIYESNKKAIRGWQYVAILDSRTTRICAHRDGTVYEPDDTVHLPPAHYNCRSTTIPVFKSWEDVAELEGVAQVRKRNVEKLTKKQRAFYDGQTPLRESYDAWLRRQPKAVQLRHLGDYQRLELFRSNQIKLKRFTNAEGNSIGIRELRKMTDRSYTLPSHTRKFALAKERLDSMQLWATKPDDFINNTKLSNTLRDYYLLQSRELDGTLALTNYRGNLIGTKRSAKRRVLANPPREDQMVFNPVTGRYMDARMFQPNPKVLENNLRLVRETKKLQPRDKEWIEKFVRSLDERMSVNERAVIADNLRIIFGRYRDKPEAWANFKAVSTGQIKYDVMNVSDALETQIRKDANALRKLTEANYIDPVLGPIQLDDIHDRFVSNILRRNKWEDKTAPKIARELRNVFDYKINPVLKARMNDDALHQFYLKFAHRLSLADFPDRDQLAIALGRDLYNLANLNGNRNKWYRAGKSLLEARNVKKFFTVETFGVQKRRMKSRISGKYFGPYYDTISYNIRINDPRIQEYAKLTREIELGMRVPSLNKANQLLIRPGYKTYFIKRRGLWEDTRIPITSTSSFSDFPTSFVDRDFASALNWAGQSQYKIDEDYYDFVKKLLYFKDDKGKAALYDDLNEYRKYIAARGDTYERFKAMEWLRDKKAAFSNLPFIDHRARIYERGLIGPQAGETFRPFLNTAVEKNFSPEDYRNFKDQVGMFLGGISDRLEGRYNSLSYTGRQKIADKHRLELVRIGNHMRRGKPNDIRKVLESELANQIDGEELGKFYRFAIEYAKIDDFLRAQTGDFATTGGLFHVSTRPLSNLDLKPRIPSNFLTKKGYEDAVTKRISFSDNLDDALKAMSSNLEGKTLYVYKAPNGTKFKVPTKAQVPDVKLTSEKWVLDDVTLEPLGTIKVGKAKKPHKYKYGDKEAELWSWNWKKNATGKNPYSASNLKNLTKYRTALALEQDASSSGAQIIALTTRNKQLAEFSNVIPTDYKKRLYDEIAADTYNDPRFKRINEKLGLTEKDLRKAAKAQNMVTFYGAGERTGALNVEGKLSKILDKDVDVLVVKASERETVLNEISARIARVERWSPEDALELRALRDNVRDIFNKGIDPGDEIMEQLWFLDPKTKDLVEKMSLQYNKVVTPEDFKNIAKIMSEHLSDRTPILKDFTKFFGELAQDFLTHAKPSKSNFDWKTIMKLKLRGSRKKGFILPDRLSEFLGLRAGEPVSEKALKKFGFYKPGDTLDEIIYGVKKPGTRRTGAKYLKLELLQLKTVSEVELFYANKLPKSWTNVPWVNFDGKVLEQNFTQTFNERLIYKDKFGNWSTNILQVPQKTEATWWEQVINKNGKINDVANITKARTAFAVNGNHSNDATLVKNFHLWGRENKIGTSTVHDAFFTNIADMIPARHALRKLYGKTLDINIIEEVLKEMKARGLPSHLHKAYLERAIKTGLIPVPGKSRINGKLVKPEDVLTKDDILEKVPLDFSEDYSWYGVG